MGHGLHRLTDIAPSRSPGTSGYIWDSVFFWFTLQMVDIIVLFFAVGIANLGKSYIATCPIGSGLSCTSVKFSQALTVIVNLLKAYAA